MFLPGFRSCFYPHTSSVRNLRVWGQPQGDLAHPLPFSLHLALQKAIVGVKKDGKHEDA